MHNSHKFLIIGSDGQLGIDFLKIYKSKKIDIIGLTHKDIDITDKVNLSKCLDKYKFDVLINTAAYHGKKAYLDVEPELHFKTNSFGPYFLAEYCKKKKITLVHFSTDYVFNGNKSVANYYFNENDLAIPSNLYGASKLAGENLIKSVNGDYIIIRVASLFGHAGCKAKNHDNFIEMIIRKYNNDEDLEIVDDIWMTPTSTELAVNTVTKIIKKKHKGVFHVNSKDNCNWYMFAEQIFDVMKYDKHKLNSVSSANKNQIIDRGFNTSLSSQKLINLNIKMPTWKYLTKKYLKDRENNI